MKFKEFPNIGNPWKSVLPAGFKPDSIEFYGNSNQTTEKGLCSERESFSEID